MATANPKFVPNPNFPGQFAGRLQTTAGATLLHQSRLIEWSRAAQAFVPVPEVAFEYSARTDIHPAFGRLMCWLTFSAGAEYLAKGVCIERGIKFWAGQNPAKVCEYPNKPIPQWLKDTNGKPKRKE